MATYASELDNFNRTRVWYVEFDLGFCGNTFGSAPCTATGTGDKKCFNTYPTCKDRSNFTTGTKTYRFCSDVSTLPFGDGERPYVRNVSQLATEIKKTLTVKGRVKVSFVDEPDTDVGIDPYLSGRSSAQTAPFFKLLYARNINFKGRPFRVYEGFLGINQAEYQLRFSGTIEDFNFDGRGGVTIEAVDKIQDLKKVKNPPKFEIQLAGDVDTAVTSITFTGDDVGHLATSTGSTVYLRAGDEVFCYQTSNFSSVSNVINPITRGLKNTSAETHSEGDKVQIVTHYEGNPFDVMVDLLTNPSTIITNPGAGLASSDVDTAIFAEWRDWWSTLSTSEITVECFNDDESLDVEKLYFDLVETMNCKSWTGEDLTVTVRRNVPNKPGRTYPKITDDANIILNSDDIDTNDGSRFTRSFLLWDFKLAGDFDKGADFLRRNVHVDLDSESSNNYDEVLEDVRRSRFLRADTVPTTRMERFVFKNIQRRMAVKKNAQPILDVSLEYKDTDIKTGEYVKVNTDAILDPLGNPLSSARFQVIKRTVQDGELKLKMEKVKDNAIGYFAPSTGTTSISSAFTAASEAQREYGYFSAADSASSTAAVMSDSSPAYNFF